ncbi:MAG TPA: serine hydrolase [Streptosporangiaceae bacterium]
MPRLTAALAAVAAACLLLLTAGPQPASAAVVARRSVPHRIHARGAELMNAATGRRLWGRNENVRRPIASITKVMTALVVIRAGNLERKVRITSAVPAYARSHGAGSAGLRAGDVLTARQLLEAMLLPSGADAAYALASTYGRGWRRFVATMNATARKLGMHRTHFANFDGLPWPSARATYSTPADLLTLARAAMARKVFRRIVGQHSHYLSATPAHHAYYWKNTNLLLGSYRGATGIKTGWTSAAGYCLLFEAVRAGRALVGVVLYTSGTDPQSRFTAARRLLNWAFG